MHTVEKTRTFLKVMRISGRVQGVGFRPFVHRLACDMGLSGTVRNQAGSVYIEIEGSTELLARFVENLKYKAPKLSKIESIELIKQAELTHPSRGFHINTSNDSADLEHLAGFPIDFALCSECKREITTPDNRRFGYPFTSCAECGPRFSITQELPFDRTNTSMSAFPFCSECDKEYGNPNNRRFHAQTISCARCGPRVRLLDSKGNTVPTEKPFHALNQALVDGGIVAIKSTGGFHLVCDAMNSSAVAELRALKRRPDKPFAVMCADLNTSKEWLNAEATDQRLYDDPRAPIVLIPKSTKGISELEHLAPACRDLGVLRPYNGIYQCLFDAASSLANRPKLIVVTSANISGEPIISSLEPFLEAFNNKASYILDHDLSIANPCDDAVIQGGKYPMLFRMGRGYAPQVLSNQSRLSHSSMQILALGAQEKSTLCVCNGSTTWISPEIGKLDNINACEHFESQCRQFTKMTKDKPMAIACDLHPDFHSTEIGEVMSKKRDVPLMHIQHHHAHVAAVLQEHNVSEPCLGLALDGFGLGTNKQAWGGELLLVEGAAMRRLGHITQLKLAGGEAASRYPLRCAHSALRMLSSETAIARLQALNTEPVWDALYDNPSCTLTSSMGRWFDAIAAILGFDAKSSYEAQAAIYLEHMAEKSTTKPEPIGVIEVQTEALNLLPLVALILAEHDLHLAAWRFHVELADGLCRWLIEARKTTGINTVAAAGGCMQNRILRERIADNLKIKGFKILLPTKIPCNDAAISLGQIYIARHTLAHHEDKPCA